MLVVNSEVFKQIYVGQTKHMLGLEHLFVT